MKEDTKDDMNAREWLELRKEFGDAVIDALALSAAAAPPPLLKDRILSRIASDPEGPARSASLPPGGRKILPGVSAVLVADAAWMPAALPGLDFKVLHRDEARGYTTRLLRFGPGSTYPAHRHGATEEVFIVSGSVVLNGVTLRAGDYCRSDAGTMETAAFSVDGGLAIIVSSDADQFVGAEA
ncbi:MAG: cupin domain-containing protein [Acidobacteriota bacterium]|nr:cupin domain-containing protein [Acidobacteriota bacterium]